MPPADESPGAPDAEPLRRSVEVLRSLVRQEIIGVYVIQDDRFRFVNGTFARTFGYEPGEMVDRLGPLDVVAEDDRETVARNLRRRREGEVEGVHYAFTGLRKDGSEVPVEVHGSRAELDGRPAISGVLLDISERTALREQLRHAQKQQALAEVTGTVAHDFNNFLTGIIGCLELALDRLDAGSGPGRDVEVARSTAERATVLTRRLLTFSRRDVARPETFDLNAVVADMGDLLRQLVGSPVNLEVETAPEPLPVHLDRGHMEQVVMNLVLNARDAMLDGGTVAVRTRREDDPEDGREGGEAGPGGEDSGDREDSPDRDEPLGGAVVLEVSDDGHGMDDDTKGRIFAAFFTTKETGTGLGLATVHRIVEEAGGRIDVDSAPGQGATFRVHLPAAQAAEAAPSRPVSPSRPDGAGEDAAPGPVRVLVVEDDDAVRRMVETALGRRGHEVRAVRTADSALEIVDEGGEDGEDAAWTPDLLLADLSLPDRSGVEVARHFLEVRPGGRVLLTSGYAPREWPGGELPGLRHGFLEKPFSLDELTDAVRSALVGEGGDAERGSAADGSG